MLQCNCVLSVSQHPDIYNTSRLCLSVCLSLRRFISVDASRKWPTDRVDQNVDAVAMQVVSHVTTNID